MAISNELLTRLVQIPIFKNLSAGEAAEFFEVAVEVPVTRDTVLFNEGDEGDSLIVVLDGTIAITRRAVELAQLGADSVVGEMTLVGGDDKRSATATALSDGLVLKVPSRRVQKMIGADHLGALKVVNNLSAVLAKRLAAINEKLVDSLDKTQRKEELADFGKILTRWSF